MINIPDKDNNKEIAYALSWIDLAIENFKNNNEVVHTIKGNMTIEEFIQRWCGEEIKGVIRLD